jgi:hypothetical protein
MRSTTIPFLLLTVALSAPIGSAAADPERPTRIDLNGGALAGGTDASVREHGTRTTAEVDAGPAVGVGAGYALTDHLEVGGHVLAADSPALFGHSVGYTSVTAGCRYYLLGRSGPVQPWLIGQGGWYRGASRFSTVFGSDTNRDENGAGVNAGGGLDVPIGKLVSVGVDLRYHQTLGVFDNAGFVTTMANVAFHFGS